jgi:hypothetical protein
MASSKLISRSRGQAPWLLFFLIAATSVLLALQQQSGCAQNASDQGRLDSQTNGEQAVNVRALWGGGRRRNERISFRLRYPTGRHRHLSCLVFIWGAGRAATTGERKLRGDQKRKWGIAAFGG